MVAKMGIGHQNRLKIGKRPFWNKFEREIITEHKQIPKYILAEDENYHGTHRFKRCFWYLAVLISNSKNTSLPKLNFGPKCRFPYLKPILAAIFCYHSNGMNEINTIRLHLVDSSDKPTRRSW